MSTTRFGALIGLALGVVWVLAGFVAAALVAVLTAVGYVAALVLEGRLDLAEYLGHRHER
ncbi:MAG: hypothetical protein M3N52_01805 [Actinomycetota bacterium]|nr:hypothetical protein [Actinomycetota bacterium]